MNQFDISYPQTAAQLVAAQNTLIRQVYAWMGAGGSRSSWGPSPFTWHHLIPWTSVFHVGDEEHGRMVKKMVPTRMKPARTLVFQSIT